MNPGASILLPVVAIVAMVAVATVVLMRYVLGKLGIKELVNEGIVLTENGIEFPRFVLMGRSMAGFADIESVELVPFPRSLTLRLRYGPSVSSRPGPGWNL